MRKTGFCLCENKGADQLPSNWEADQRLCFRYTDSTMSLLLKSEISSCTDRFVSDLVRNTEDLFSRLAAHVMHTCFSSVIILSKCLLMKLHPRNLSRGDRGMYSCCSILGFRRVSNASWERSVGMAAAQARWGRILDGGLITTNN